MATDLLESSHGKTRPPRVTVSRLSSAASEPERSHNHDALGRFTRGNRAPADRGVKVMLKRQLGKDATDAVVQQLYRETRVLFLAELAQMPCKPPAVQRDLAARARWSALSAHYAQAAAQRGLETPEGIELVELSLKCDARAERLGVTALAIAERTAKRQRGKKAKPVWQQLADGVAVAAAGSEPTTATNTSDTEPSSEWQPGATEGQV